MIERNRHPAGRSWNALFGLAQIGDGLVRVLSFGFCHSTLALTVSRQQAKTMIKRTKDRRHAP